MKTQLLMRSKNTMLFIAVLIIISGNLFAQKYRYQQPYLFQAPPFKELASKISGGYPFNYQDRCGPTNICVDFQTGWIWKNVGGDWLDKNLLSQGTTPWFSIPAGSNTVPLNQRVSYQGDITDIVKHVYTSGTWNAYLLDAVGGPRVMATPYDSLKHAPKIFVKYTDQTTDTLRCRIVAANTGSSSTPIACSPGTAMPLFVEFDKPARAVQVATLYFDIVQHWGGNASLEGYLLDPPKNNKPTEFGVAANTGALDLQIKNQPGVLGAHRYIDGTTFTDFAVLDPINTGAEFKYDPAIYGTGPQDTNLLPHYGLGKWIDATNWSLVPSSYTGDGFKPLAPGLGAMKMVMPNYNPQNGDTILYTGGFCADANLYLPDSLNGKPLFGELDHIFIRYYFYIGTPFHRSPDDRKQFYVGTGAATKWADLGGKWGIAPDHSTTYGSNSGSSGGGKGWQMRSAWLECDAGVGGPNEGGWSVGHHYYDFLYNNPPGYNYGAELSGPESEWGRDGMNLLYAGNWYCIETEMKLNTINNTDSGFVPDGFQKVWIDGRLAFEKYGMVFRTPPDSFPNNDPLLYLRPIRSLGIRNLKSNWWHGGLTPSTVDRTTFFTGLVWGTQYIGPMKMLPSGIANEQQSNADNVSVYPNPSTDLFKVSINNHKQQEANISVYDITSKLIYSNKLQLTNGTTTFNLDLSENSKGVYFLHIVSDDGIVNKKVVKY